MNEDCFHLGVKALIRNREGKILLLKVNTANFKIPSPAYWDIPGGRIHRGSTIEETLRREVEEETGITDIRSFTPFSMVLSNIRIPDGETTVGLILGAYLCEVEAAEIRISDEHLDFSWFSPKEAGKLLEFKYPKEFTDKIAAL